MAARNSNFRKPFVDAARSMVPSYYRLKDPSGDQKESLMELNRRELERLLSEALFAHRVRLNQYGSSML
jgi:hypothetical protein